MGRKKNRKPLLENVEFFDLADKGKAVGRAEEQIVFVSGPIPGDVADVQVFKK
jgi:23S rRNA (uracil1939-C5)-methyltransferase